MGSEWIRSIHCWLNLKLINEIPKTTQKHKINPTERRIRLEETTCVAEEFIIKKA
jgi:hypothetical protein